jgi:sulfatase maturation enzyme AslB (radical SAM superfamily)
MTQYICSKMFTDLNIKFPYNCIKNCCKSNDIVIETDELSKENFLIENKEYLRRKASMLFKNKLPINGCDTCIITEPNSLFKSWNTWNHEISSTQKEQFYQADLLNTYEFVLSSACDLKCIYCAPKDSTSWAKELNVPINKGNDQWEEAVLSELFKHLSNKNFTDDKYYFFFSGGEPTYNPKTLWMIEKILELVPLSKSKIIISTNANTKSSVFQKYLNVIRERREVNWVFDCSIDSVGKKCEAVRHGINWDLAISNISKLLQEPNVDVRISPTVNMYSIPDMEDFVNFFIRLFKDNNKLHKYIFNFNMVQEPDLSPMSMPIKYKQLLDNPIEICRKENIVFYTHLQNVQNLIGTKIDNNTSFYVKEKFNYFKTKRPETDWDLLFPHVKDIIEELKLK